MSESKYCTYLCYSFNIIAAYFDILWHHTLQSMQISPKVPRNVWIVVILRMREIFVLRHLGAWSKLVNGEQVNLWWDGDTCISHPLRCTSNIAGYSSLVCESMHFHGKVWKVRILQLQNEFHAFLIYFFTSEKGDHNPGCWTEHKTPTLTLEKASTTVWSQGLS